MVLHHLIAITLIVFSYFAGQIPIGLCVLMCHDIGDVFLNLGKMSRDLALLPNRALDFMYLLILVTWLYPRCYVTSTTYIWMGIQCIIGWIKLENPYIG